MVPREAGRGSSFRGAGMYYLHDKNAETSDRVVFTHTENIPTEDPEKALKWMAWTAMHAEELKRQTGSRMTGRPCTKPVFSFSLAWHPEQQSEKWQMIAAGRQALFALDLQDHEALMVAHDDCDHAHLHILANLCHPETGYAKRLSFSRLKLSKWAEEYEREHGKIYCEQRVENNQRREQGQFTKYEEPQVDLKAKITELYFQCDSGKAFRSALAEHGLKLAQGKRIVVLDAEGKIHSLSRQIEGATAKDIRAKLGDLQLPEVDSARDQGGSNGDKPEPKQKPDSAARTKEDDYFDRDQQDQDWQESVIDAAIEHEEQKSKKRAHKATELSETEASKPASSKPTSTTNKLGSKPFEQPEKPPASPQSINLLQDRYHAELGHFYTANTHARLKLASLFDQQYGAHERQLRHDIMHLETTLNNSSRLRIWWLKFTRQIPKEAEQDVQNMRQTLENIEWRKSEAQQALESDITLQRQLIQQRQLIERHELQPAPECERKQNAPGNAAEPGTDEDFGPSFDL